MILNRHKAAFQNILQNVISFLQLNTVKSFTVVKCCKFVLINYGGLCLRLDCRVCLSPILALPTTIIIIIGTCQNVGTKFRNTNEILTITWFSGWNLPIKFIGNFDELISTHQQRYFLLSGKFYINFCIPLH